MEIRWHGPVWGQSGYEELTRGMLIALDKIGVTIELQPANDWNLERVAMDPEDINRLVRMQKQRVHPEAIQVCHQRPTVEYKAARKKICYSLFETNRCPDAWIEDLDRMDEVWVFSEFNRKHWAAGWIQRHLDADKIKVIPFGVHTNLFQPDVDPAWITNKKGFTFMTVGDFTERKNFEGLIEAFVTEFSEDDDVCLMMKVHYLGFIRRHQDDCLRRLKEIVQRFRPEGAPRILFFGNKISTTDMPRFYASGDCFVLASRGEGLGIPMIEAMSCGKPVIATDWGAQTDYISATEETGLLVRSDIRQIDDASYIQKCIVALNHSWAFPDVGDLREKMRWMYEHPDEAKEMGAAARRAMLPRTWQNTALAIVKTIMEMA